MTKDSSVDDILHELRRIGLDPAELGGIAVNDSDMDDMLERLRALPVGSSWADVFPGSPAGWSPNSPSDDRALGPFDYQQPPRGNAVFASLDSEDPVRDGEAAIHHARQLGPPVYGAGLVLDRGHPHLYVVLALDATEEDAELIAHTLREKGGIGNSWPIVRTPQPDT